MISRPSADLSNAQLLDYFHRRLPAMQHLLEQFVQLESPSTEPAAQQPLLTQLQQALEQRGLATQRVAGTTTGGYVLGLYPHPSQQPQQLLLGHCDTVWPLGTLDHMPLRVSQGRLYGPGCYDMKAGLVMLLCALELFQAYNLTPTVAPIVLINSDEEIGSRESTEVIRQLAKTVDRTLVLEPSLGPHGQIKTSRKGVGRFTVRVLGQAAHAGLDPGKGASAILELSHVIQQLFALNDPARGITVNVGTIDGGIRSNVVAPESRAVVDVRVLHSADMAQVQAAILSLQPTIPGTQLAISGGIGRPPMEATPGNRRLWQLAQTAAADLGFAITETTAGGGSDGNTTSAYGPTLDGLGAIGEGAHAPNEMVYLDSLVERGALLAKLLLAPALGPISLTPNHLPAAIS